MNVVFNVYKFFVGPALQALGGAGYGCRYHPSCSEYARTAFREHSFGRALGLTLLRLLRCNPWTHRPSWDPVPPRPLKASVST